VTRGRILIIPTPIGNLDDASPRMIASLRACDLLLCEDTRHTGKLLHLLGVDARLESFHEHNEKEKLESVLQRVEEGATVGVVSDAGMPLLSDPGFPLVRTARDRGIRVVPIAGPSAILSALAASGLAPIPFTFHGFPPQKRGERIEFYRRVAGTKTTAVVFESPHRILESLDDALHTLGNVRMTLARELTKLHEQIVHGTISEVIEALGSRDSVRGEITLVFDAAASDEREIPDSGVLRDELASLREKGLRRNDAVKALAEKYGLARNELYRMLVDEE
jgi:16S rRNA (cytidine1402-2'-O)-methyltransferase